MKFMHLTHFFPPFPSVHKNPPKLLGVNYIHFFDWRQSLRLARLVNERGRWQPASCTFFPFWRSDNFSSNGIAREWESDMNWNTIMKNENALKIFLSWCIFWFIISLTFIFGYALLCLILDLFFIFLSFFLSFFLYDPFSVFLSLSLSLFPLPPCSHPISISAILPFFILLSPST